MRRSRPAPFRLLDAVAVLAAACVATWRFLALHAVLAPSAAPVLGVFRTGLPHTPPTGFGWWSWWDQSWYLESALAWAQFNRDPALHWYPPGYPVLGALFSRVTPADPFLLPNLLCLLGALWLFAAITVRLLGAVPFARGLGAWLFVATTALPGTVLWAWVVPWTTTPETVCLYACLLATLCFVQRGRFSDAFWAAFAAAATLAFRPVDGAVVGLVCGLTGLAALCRRWRGGGGAARVAAAAILGGAIPVALYAAAYLSVNGWHLDGYLTVSGEFGFEWRLLPQRWISLVIDPKPVFVDGQGLAQVFPWIVSGMAGMAACLVRRPLSLACWAVAAAVLCDSALFLCYRDLHPTFLWQNGIYHYFKWTLPVFGLFTVLLLRGLVQGPRILTATAAAGVLLGLFMWRSDVTGAVALARPARTQVVELPTGLPDIDDVLLARISASQAISAPYGSEIHAGATTYRGAYAFNVTSWPKTIMVQPLRPMAAVPSTLVLPPFYTLDTAVAPVLAQQRAVWGLPCWVRPERLACQTGFLLPAPPLAMDTLVTFGAGGSGEVYALAGLSLGETSGDWTNGSHAILAFRLPPGSVSPMIEVAASGYVPAGGPTRVSVFANGVRAGTWQFGQGVSTVRAALPVAAMRDDGNVWLELAVANPRAPSAYVASSDTRALGIQLRSLQVVTGP